MNIAETSLKVLLFNGKASTFEYWGPKFEARARKKKTSPIFLGSTVVPSETAYEAVLLVAEASRTDAQKKTIKDFDLNSAAYDELIMSMDDSSDGGKIAFQLVNNAHTVANPNGDAKLAWDRLTAKYRPSTAPRYMRLEKLLVNSKLSFNKNPDPWMTYVEQLMGEMNKCTVVGKSAKTETDIILHILCHLPESYEGVVQEQSTKLEENPTSCTLMVVRERIMLRYERLKDHRNNRDNSRSERALAEIFQDMNLDDLDDIALAAFVRGQFKGTCNQCGLYGHKGVDCNKHPNNNNKNAEGEKQKFKGECRYCGILGHKQADCRKRERAMQNKPKGETAKLARGESDDDHYSFMEGSGNESIDELGFVAGVFERESDQLLVTAPKRKRVTFDDIETIIENSEQMSSVNKLNVQSVLRPIKRQRSVSENMTEMNTEVCYVASGYTGQYPQQSDMDEDNPRRSFHQRQKHCMIDGNRYPAFTDNTMYGDTASSCHLTNDDTDMYDVVLINDNVSGIGGAVTATKKGKKRYIFVNEDGSSVERVLDPVKFSVNGTCLFAVNNELSKGAKISNNERNDLILTYPDGVVIRCDRRIRTKDGWVSGVDAYGVQEKHSELAHLGQEDSAKNAQQQAKPKLAIPVPEKKKKSKSEPINEYHKQLGHPNLVVTRSTAKARDVSLTGTAEVCNDCAVGKARQKNVPKATVKRATVPGERMFIDITSPKVIGIGGQKHWLLVLDDASDCGFSFFMSHKDMLALKLVPFVKKLKAEFNIDVRIIRCDNAGENKSFEEASKREGLNIKFEYTAVNTPQQNGRVERKLQTLYGRLRATLLGCGIEMPIRNRLWPECANTLTDMDNILVKPGETTDSFQQFFGEGAKSNIDSTKKFGESCVVADRTKIKAKLSNRGKPGKWLGYEKSHPKGTYRILNTKTNRVIISRDVVFSGKEESCDNKSADREINDLVDEGSESDDSYADMPELIRRRDSDVSDSSTDSDYQPESDEDNSDDDEESVSSSSNSEDDYFNDDDGYESEDSCADMPALISPSQQVVNAMKKLDTSYNPIARNIVESHESVRPVVNENAEGTTTGTIDKEESVIADVSNYLVDMAQVATDTDLVDSKPQYVEPTKFAEAWNHPDPIQRLKWRAAILKEWGDMDTRKVYRRFKRSDMPKNRRCVKSKWVFKIKRDGTFRARIVACGYSQIAGVDFKDNYSPVVNDISFRILLLAMLFFGLTGKIADVETAFLYGELEEEIFMECPPGMKNTGPNDILALQACIYGLVQASRQFHKKMVELLRKIGFTGGDSDPCLFVRKNKFGICYIAIYVDDNLMVGHEAAINETIRQIEQEGLVLKVEDNLHDYLSCEIVFSEDKKRAWLGQPHLISKLEETFGDTVKGLRKYLTPGTPGMNQVREMDKELCLPPEKQKLYRSGVGMLLYLVKHSRPDIANCVRELSKCLDGSTEACNKEMHRVIKYVLDTKDMGLKLWPTGVMGEPWRMVVFTDSDYAGDPVSRRSVSGYIIYLHGVPLCWRSKAQRSVTLSSTEAEWVSLSEAVKDIVFVLNICESISIDVELPVTVRVDNVGAIFMSNNVTTTSGTRHVDIRTKFVKEYQVDGKIKIIFVRSEENDSDIMTKNLGSLLYSKHANKLIVKK